MPSALRATVWPFPAAIAGVAAGVPAEKRSKITVAKDTKASRRVRQKITEFFTSAGFREDEFNYSSVAEKMGATPIRADFCNQSDCEFVAKFSVCQSGPETT